jgi:hypothetical protein
MEEELDHCASTLVLRANALRDLYLMYQSFHTLGPKESGRESMLIFVMRNRLTFMIIVDSHSQWQEIKIMPSTMACRTVEFMRSFFTWQLPETVVSGNDPSFKPENFKTFAKRNGIKQVSSTTYYAWHMVRKTKVCTTQRKFSHNQYWTLELCALT